MASKSESLSFPADPLAALRALQDLDAPAAPPREPPPPSRRRASPDHRPRRRPAAEEVALPVARRRRSPRRGEGGEPRETSRSGRGTHPTRWATPSASSWPGPTRARGARVPVTVSTVKIPTEVWERLGWVAAITGRTKQDLIAEALKGYFRVVLEGG